MIVTALLLVVACSSSHEPPGDVDAGFDAGALDAELIDADLPDGLAPRCRETPMTPCLVLTSSTTFRTGDRRLDDTGLDGTLHGLAYDDGPAVLHQFQFDIDGSWSSQWALRRFAPDGALAGDPLFLTGSYVHRGELGGDLGTWDGALVVGWREERPDGAPVEPATARFDTYASIGGAAVTDPIHSIDLGAAGEDGIDVAVAAGLVITDVADGLLVSRVDGPGDPTRVTTTTAPFGKLSASALGPHHAVVAWSEDHGAGLEVALSTEAVVIRDSMVTVGSRIFEPSLGAIGNYPQVVVIGEDIWLARYDLDPARLRESRIRVAHLDTSLRRLEPDRWFAGWGGLSPDGLSLVTWQGAPWLVWRTLDARYGANTVLYARPIPESACGYDVSDPLAIWRPEAVGDRLDGLLVTSSADALWVATPQIAGRGTADLYQFRLCE